MLMNNEPSLSFTNHRRRTSPASRTTLTGNQARPRKVIGTDGTAVADIGPHDILDRVVLILYLVEIRRNGCPDSSLSEVRPVAENKACVFMDQRRDSLPTVTRQCMLVGREQCLVVHRFISVLFGLQIMTFAAQER